MHLLVLTLAAMVIVSCIMLMAPLTAPRNTSYSERKILSVPVAGGVQIFAGSLVCANALGYAEPADDDPAFLFLGVAEHSADNRLGQDGDIEVVVRRTYRERFDYRGILNQSALGACVYAVDDHIVDCATANSVLVGTIARVESATVCWIDMQPPCRVWAECSTTTAMGTTTTQGGI